MPELAEVEHARQVWDVALGDRVREVVVNKKTTRVFREVDLSELTNALVGKALVRSEARGKQMVFCFGKKEVCWLGIHLGMSGRLRVEDTEYVLEKHDHLVLRQAKRTLIFRDPRHFGRVRFDQGKDEPNWWSSIAPAIASAEFTAALVGDFLTRHKRAPLKAVLLMQARFPGVGNWMADEILWRARLHPSTLAGALDKKATKVLWQSTQTVAQLAIETINEGWDYPASWLFAHRWKPGGDCPRCHTGLMHDTIGGRTTCWCPKCQPEQA